MLRTTSPGQARGIVGIELPIRSIEGSGRSAKIAMRTDRNGVAEGLAELASRSPRHGNVVLEKSRYDSSGGVPTI